MATAKRTTRASSKTGTRGSGTTAPTTSPAPQSAERPPGLSRSDFPPDLERVPTVAELVGLGLASQVPESGKIYRVTKEGHALMGAAMARNAERWRQWQQHA